MAIWYRGGKKTWDQACQGLSKVLSILCIVENSCANTQTLPLDENKCKK